MRDNCESLIAKEPCRHWRRGSRQGLVSAFVEWRKMVAVIGQVIGRLACCNAENPDSRTSRIFSNSRLRLAEGEFYTQKLMHR